jgi:hypothetical protein
MYELLCICKPINKKYKFQVDLLNKETKRTKSIKFGLNGMMDYTLYNTEEGKKVADKHKRLYLIRHKKREDWTKSGIDTAGFWSRWMLWNKPTLEESINHIIKKFNLN